MSPSTPSLRTVAVALLLPLLVAASPAATSTKTHASSKSATPTTGSSGGGAKCGSGSAFELNAFSLQLPTGSPGKPETISSSQLCSGWSDKDHFFVDAGALVMKVPGSPASANCVTTTNSKHCRTELRESKSWAPTAATNKLSATLMVVKADDSKYGTVVGQIHIDDSVSSKPVCELYYNAAGELTMGVEQTRSGGNSKYTVVGQVAVGTKFSYEIAYEGGKLSVSVNGKTTQLDTYQLDSPSSYFKAGNYNQGNSASEVHFFSIAVQH